MQRAANVTSTPDKSNAPVATLAVAAVIAATWSPNAIQNQSRVAPRDRLEANASPPDG